MGKPSGMAATAKLHERETTSMAFVVSSAVLPHTDGEHLQQMPSLQPANNDDEPDNAQRVERQLFAQGVHALLQRCFRCLLLLHHLEDFAELGMFTRADDHALGIAVENVRAHEDDILSIADRCLSRAEQNRFDRFHRWFRFTGERRFVDGHGIRFGQT